ncbi:hypothetical protein MVES1_002347 [Malassezia vespertilionis]|uniref:uncharacterized protein n=1 Tax=Malassezia vespertilionis TaxID=2020962 RepID=UPI0024B20F17|nr:uncharacterized protein MVES1_002347 [Malassezia vespertilionis]WFD06992.1 hypothetical protein MVES1_002347 [Malassezia vespertilionis]
MSAMERRDRDRDADMDIEDEMNVRRRGRGFGSSVSEDADRVKVGDFERLVPDAESGDVDEHAARCTYTTRLMIAVEGWVIIVTNIHEEAAEDDVMDVFLDFGKVKDLALNLDRRTGYVKGYALIQYEMQSEARDAIDACKQGLTLLEQGLNADFAFVQPPKRAPQEARRRARRERSRSPMRP